MCSRTVPGSICICLVCLLAATKALPADMTWEYAVQLSATVQALPPRIVLTWPQDAAGIPASYTVHRKAPGAATWGSGVVLPGTQTNYVDANVSVGAAYEYQVVKTNVALGYRGYGYLYAGIEVPVVDDRGAIVLLVDDTFAAVLAPEITRLQQDLVGDGWRVIRHEVPRSASPPAIKALIQTAYNSEPARVKAVLLLGRIPVVRSGNLNVDGHGARPLPADVFYGDMDGHWSDADGNGIYDPGFLPSDVELAVGRVDFANLPGRLTWNGPPTFPSETELLRRYLEKDHQFRHARVPVSRRALVGDGFGASGGYAHAASGYRNFAALVGAENVAAADTTFTAPAGRRWASLLGVDSYLWAYGCGGGSYTSMSSLGTHPEYNDVWSADLVQGDTRAVFLMMFGSWLVDWDSTDNIMRAALATPAYGLTCSWSGWPHHFYQHMGLGETIGHSIRVTQNNNGLYRNQRNSLFRGIHIALLGDPTLRMHPVPPPTALSATPVLEGVRLDWAPPVGSVMGYHVYRSQSVNGPFARLTASPVAGTQFTDTTAPPGPHTYLVRALRLEVTPSGSFFNPSQGIFVTSDNAGPALPTVTVTTSTPGASELGPVPGSFTIHRTGDTGGALTVHFNLSGMAGNGIDYESLNLSVALAPGQSAVSVVVRSLSDPLEEGVETVVLTLVPRATYNVGDPAVAVVTIADAPMAETIVTVTVAGPNASEIGPRAGVFRLSRSGNMDEELTVYFTLSGSAEMDLDYEWIEESVTFYSGESFLEVFVFPWPDPLAEGAETVVLTLLPDDAYAVGAPASATLIIDDAPVEPVIVTVTADGPVVSEDDYYPGVFIVQRTGFAMDDLTVYFNLGGDAINGVDYERLDGSVTIYAGETFAEVFVMPIRDLLAEGDETIVLTVYPDPAYRVGQPASATIVILANTPPVPPTVTVVASDADAAPVRSNTGTFTFTREGDTADELAVDVSFAGTALPETDYGTSEGEAPAFVVFAPGEAAATLTIFPVALGVFTGTKTVVLTLRTGKGYVVGAPGSATVTITSNGVSEGTIATDASGRPRITWPGAPGRTYRVAFKHRLSDADWIVAPGVVTATGATASWSDPELPMASERYYVVFETD